MNKIACPRDCPNRRVTADYNCHSHCIRYLLFQRKHKKELEEKLKLAKLNESLYESKRVIRARAVIRAKNAQKRRDY